MKSKNEHSKFHENSLYSNHFNKRILIIDDDLDILKWFYSIKDPSQPYSFHFLDDELKVRDAIQAIDPDMVFIDVCLNSVSGKVIGEIIESTSYFKIPLVYMSSTEDLRLEAGAKEYDFMAKPLNKNTVEEKISKILKIAS